MTRTMFLRTLETKPIVMDRFYHMPLVVPVGSVIIVDENAANETLSEILVNKHYRYALVGPVPYKELMQVLHELALTPTFPDWDENEVEVYFQDVEHINQARC